MGGVGGFPIELIATGRPPFDVSYCLYSRRPEDILALSILTPLSYQPNVSYRRGATLSLYPIPPMRGFYGMDSYQAEYDAALSSWKPRYQLCGKSYRAPLSFGFRANLYAASLLSKP